MEQRQKQEHEQDRLLQEMSPEEIEQRVESARELGLAASARRPNPRSWGMYSYGDVPGIDGDLGGFLWFDSEIELFEFISQYLPFDQGVPLSVPVEGVLKKIGGIIDKLRKGEMEREQARPALNKALRGFSVIEWWGTRCDLFSGDSKFAREVRCQFRQKDEDFRVSDGPVTTNEQRDFLDFVDTYCETTTTEHRTGN